VFLSSYLFVIGLYSLAISIAQDSSLRKSIRKSTIEQLGEMGTAQMEQETLGKIRKLAQINKQDLEDQSGIFSSLTTEAVREYTEMVVMEREMEKEKSSYRKDGK
jgi:hypothetical protein